MKVALVCAALLISTAAQASAPPHHFDNALMRQNAAGNFSGAAALRPPKRTSVTQRQRIRSSRRMVVRLHPEAAHKLDHRPGPPLPTPAPAVETAPHAPAEKPDDPENTDYPASLPLEPDVRLAADRSYLTRTARPGFTMLEMAEVSAEGVAGALENLYRQPQRCRELAQAALAVQPVQVAAQ